MEEAISHANFVSAIYFRERERERERGEGWGELMRERETRAIYPRRKVVKLDKAMGNERGRARASEVRGLLRVPVVCY